MNTCLRWLVGGALTLSAASVVLAQPSIAPPSGAQPVTAQPSLNAALVAAADSFAALSRPIGGPRAWADQSDATRIAQRARADRVLAMLYAVPSASLSSSAEQLLHENLIEVSEGGRASRVCRFHLWYSPNPFAGWHIAASNWARNVPVGDSTRRAGALAALRALPQAIRDERALLARGLDSGYVSSQQVIDVAVRQFRDLLTDDVSRSPLAAPLTRDTASTFAAAWTAVLRDSVYPVARDYAAWLQASYRPAARTDGSLRGLPDGRACYNATMRQSTSVDLDPESLMDESRREIDRLHTALAPMIRRVTGLGVADGIRALKTDPRFTFSSRDTILAAYRAMTALAATRIGRVVAGYEPESVVVIPYPEFQERAGLPPSYQRAPDDRSRPAWFLVNLGRPERMAVGNAAAHEAYPGHHLQRIAASQATSIHPVMRNLFVSAFSEGWGIYSEDLGAEMGLYTTELDSIGHLVHILDVAVAYYLDAGTHVRGWTRAMLVDSMFAIGGRTRAQAADYADRHAATPGQLATYYVGYRVIRAARADAERRLGARFDLAQFNREVLRDGTITLSSLQAKLEAWVKSREEDPAPVPAFAEARWRWSGGGAGTDWITRVRELRDGSIVATGFVDRDLTTPNGWDAVVLRFTADGTPMWERRISGPGLDALWDVRETPEGFLALSGFRSARAGEASDAWLLVLDREGETIVDRTYGGVGDDRGMSLVPTSGGDFLIVGETVATNTTGRDVLLIRTDSVGTPRWQRTIATNAIDRGFFVEPHDDGFVIAGVTGQVEAYDLLVLRVNGEGRELWRRVIGGPGNDPNHGLNILPDGRIVVVGYSNAAGARSNDLVAVTLAPDGRTLHHEMMGGPGDDRVMASATDYDGGTMLFGYTTSVSGGNWDVMIARLTPDGRFEPWIAALGAAADDHAYAGVIRANGALLIGGYSAAPSRGAAPADLLVLELARERIVQRTTDVRVRTP